MAFTTTNLINALFKKSQGKSSSNDVRQFFEEPRDGRAAVFQNQIWVDSNLILSPAPGGTDQQVQGVVKRWIDLTLTAVPGVSNSFFSANLVNCIPFNFGDGTYNYSLKDSTGAAIAFGQGDWLVDIDTGTLTFYGTTPANMPPKISFYQYVGTLGGLTAPTAWTQFTLANNTASQTITGAVVNSLNYYSFEMIYLVTRTSISTGGNAKAQRGRLIGCFNGTSWEIVEGVSSPTDGGATFAINASTGQVSVSTDNQAGTYQASTSYLQWKIIERI